jgi:hypothetical protein
MTAIMPHNEPFRGGRCYVGRAADGTVSLYLPLQKERGEYTIEWSKGDLEMDNEVLPDGPSAIPCRVFRLFDKEKSENFFDLMTGIVALLEDDDTPFEAMNGVVTGALTKWHGLFSEQSKLSLLGLYGELSILDILRQYSNPEQALLRWHGPWKTVHQDFCSLNRGYCLEVKAKLGTSTTVPISSGHQLDTPGGEQLLLAIVRGEIRMLPTGTTSGASIPQLVASMCKGPASFDGMPRFADGCRREGYFVGGPSNALLRKEIVLHRLDFYDARQLPRLVPSTIPASPQGIDPASVQYEIDLERHEPVFSLDMRAVGISGLHGSPVGTYLQTLANA